MVPIKQTMGDGLEIELAMRIAVVETIRNCSVGRRQYFEWITDAASRRCSVVHSFAWVDRYWPAVTGHS